MIDNKNLIVKLISSIVLAISFGYACCQNIASPENLQCAHLISPIGIDESTPSLSWQLKDERKGGGQTAYEIEVYENSLDFTSKKGLVWHTGKILSSLPWATYGGRKLQPFTCYYWRVRIWDKDNQITPVSAISWFETGMMNSSNWIGNWISDGGTIETKPAPYFRKKFFLKKAVKSARIYVAAAGLYELSINGARQGDHRLDPMFTRFDRRTLYVTHDLTDQLNVGENVVGILLGNGWYNHQSLAVWNFDKAPWRQRPSFCADLRITYADGTCETIGTDKSWRTATGPLTFNSIYTGEHFDSRLIRKGWDTADFDDQKWNYSNLRPAPSKNIVSQSMVPIRDADTLKPVNIKTFGTRNYVFDMGRNIAGVSEIKVSGDSGTVVRIIHGERVYKEGPLAGHVDLSNIDVYYRPKDTLDRFQTDMVTLNGTDSLTFRARFNYKGFQYVEVQSSKPVTLNQHSVKAFEIHSDVNAVGGIESSNPLINKIWRATNNSYLSNLMGYPTDCPQREKNGWTGDGHFAVETGLYNFDAFTVYAKWMDDHRDEQQPNGVLPDIIPTSGWGYGTANGTDWTSTIVIIPWNLYLFYGDKKPLIDNFGSMKLYVDHIDQISPTGLTSYGRGDWVPVKSRSSLEYTSSVYFYADAIILSKIAKVLGAMNDYKKYSELAKKVRAAINAKYLDLKNGTYCNGTQTELSMALTWNVVPNEYRKVVAKNLAARVAADNMHIDVGVLGARAILTALSANGQAETAYKLASQSDYPSWGWWIVNGATTLFENWDLKAERDISENHMMFGDVGGWFFRGIAGIQPDENNPGFKNIILNPNFITDLQYFNAWHSGPFGKVISNWDISGENITYNVTIPPSSTAILTFPDDVKVISVNGKIIPQTNEAQKLDAGKYVFKIKRSQH